MADQLDPLRGMFLRESPAEAVVPDNDNFPPSAVEKMSESFGRGLSSKRRLVGKGTTLNELVATK